MGLCLCKEHHLEVLEPQCVHERDRPERHYLTGIYSAALIASVAGIAVAIMARRRVILMKTMEFLQLTSLYLYINMVYPFNLNQILQALRYANIEPIFEHLYKPLNKTYTA
jgi:hypothetical protein